MAAAFTVDQIAEIERRITVHVGVQTAEFGGFLQHGAAQVEEARVLLAEHNAELHRSSDRISALVTTVNEKSAELTKLTEDISAFASQQKLTLDQFEAKAVEQSAPLERLTLKTEDALVKLEQALVGIDGKLINAVEECRTTTVGNIDVLRNQLYTFAVGAKAEITEIVRVIKAGNGFDGKSGSSGKGFDGVARAPGRLSTAKKSQYGKCLRRSPRSSSGTGLT